MDPVLLFVPGIIYAGFVGGMIMFWVKRRRRQCKFTEEDERLFEEMLKKAAEDGTP